MKQIILPVAPLSRKILLSEYQSEPILAPKKSLFYHKLKFRSTDFYSRPQRLMKLLTARVTVEVPNAIADSISRHRYHVGYYLYINDVEEMCKFATAQHAAGVKVMQALRNYYALHNIDEEDFARETAYKRYQRFTSERKKHRHNTPQNRRSHIGRTQEPSPDLHEMLGIHIHRSFDHFVNSAGKPRIGQIRKAYYYLLARQLQVPVSRIAQDSGLTHQTISGHISDIARVIEPQNESTAVIQS